MINKALNQKDDDAAPASRIAFSNHLEDMLHILARDPPPALCHGMVPILNVGSMVA